MVQQFIEKRLPSNLKRKFRKASINTRRFKNQQKAQLNGVISNSPLVLLVGGPFFAASLTIDALAGYVAENGEIGIKFLDTMAQMPGLGDDMRTFGLFVGGLILAAAFGSHGDHRTPKGINLMGQEYEAKEQYKAYLIEQEIKMVSIGEEYADLEREEDKAVKRLQASIKARNEKREKKNKKPISEEKQKQMIDKVLKKYLSKKQNLIDRLDRIQTVIIDVSDDLRITKNPDPPTDMTDEEKEVFANRQIYDVPSIEYVLALGKQKMEERLKTVLNQKREVRSARAETEEIKEVKVEAATPTPDVMGPVIPQRRVPGRYYPAQSGGM